MTRVVSPKARWVARFGIIFAALALALGGFATTSSAASVTPTLVLAVPGSGGQWACDGGTKFDPVLQGTFPADFGGFTGSITITLHNTAAGPTFDFDTGHSYDLVTSVLVKGGPNANLYSYGGSGVQSDTDLHAPLNPNNGKWYGLSHLCFFTEKT